MGAAKAACWCASPGRETAEHPDALLPVKLLAGDRQLGGSHVLEPTRPASPPFPPPRPSRGLAVPGEVQVTRQVLAEPGAHLAEQTWARLADGTPLVTKATRGAGRIVLFHVTANADWSDLPLSGLFVDMLRRLVALAGGVAGARGRRVRAAGAGRDAGRLRPARRPRRRPRPR